MIQRVTSSNVRPHDLHTSSPRAVVQKPRHGESRLWAIITNFLPRFSQANHASSHRQCGRLSARRPSKISGNLGGVCICDKPVCPIGHLESSAFGGSVAVAANPGHRCPSCCSGANFCSKYPRKKSVTTNDGPPIMAVNKITIGNGSANNIGLNPKKNRPYTIKKNRTVHTFVHRVFNLLAPQSADTFCDNPGQWEIHPCILCPRYRHLPRLPIAHHHLSQLRYA